MCGIVGKINLNKEKVKREEIERMLQILRHRGPDGSNVYLDRNIGLGHVLLKIQDLTNDSIQPFKFENYILVYNGEIYNYKDLREDLIKKGYLFKTDGDTEVLIKYIHCYGLDKTLKDIEGCYAFAIYDKLNELTYIVRDRFGIKPLHYYKDNNKFIFASEIKSILENKEVKRKFDLETVAISFNCKLWMDSKKTLFQNIYMLEPGHYLKIHDKDVEDVQYYKLEFSNEYKDEKDLIKDFSNELNKSIQKKLISKVPIAAFLSGGIDSSIVCKLLNDKMKEPLNTYTICYNNDNDLDLNYASQLSKSEGFNQHNILISEDMYNIENIDKVTQSVEEILIDKVYIPMYFNYKAAKDDGFTVVVTGQGSDEVWLGYIYTWRIFEYIGQKGNFDTLLKEYYLNNMLFNNKLNNNFKRIIEPTMRNYLNKNLRLNKKDLLNSYGDLSVRTILHDLLMQEDKIAMAHSIESRVPFVDSHKLVELAYKASSKIKIFDGREKYIVRKFSKGKIIDGIIEREKYPFPEPPSIYNEKVRKLCVEYWSEIKESKVLKLIIDFERMQDINDFTPTEQWLLLVYWRFEKVFKMEV